MASQPRTYQLKITLLRVRPPVWRRILAPSTMTLGELHGVIQIVMGWTDSHLHAYEIDGRTIGIPDPEFDDGTTEDENEVLLGSVLRRKGEKAGYTYDFGDNWEHSILLEDIRKEPIPYTVCIGGRRAGPPEDCGGPYGFAELSGEPGGSAALDVAEINEQLRFQVSFRLQ